MLDGIAWFLHPPSIPFDSREHLWKGTGIKSMSREASNALIPYAQNNTEKKKCILPHDYAVVGHVDCIIWGTKRAVTGKIRQCRKCGHIQKLCPIGSSPIKFK
jgi:hypothetical protein